MTVVLGMPRPPSVTGRDRKPRRRRRWRVGVAGGILLIIILMAIFAPIVAPHDPLQQDIANLGKPPSGEYWLGTDASGMDVFSRLLYGAQVSLSVAAVAALISGAIGVIVGALSGYFGGFVDAVLQRVTEVFMSFPTLLLMIAVAAAFGPSELNAMIIIGIFGWPDLARLTRAEFLSLKTREFILAVETLGGSRLRIMALHLLPNSAGVISVNIVYTLRNAILAEAGLSFLGVGVPPPEPSWGSMVSVATQLIYLESLPWAWIPPAVMIVLLVVSVGFLADRLSKAVRG